MSREIESIKRIFTQEVIDQYAVVSGDHNRIHTDPEYAKSTLFGGTVAHGMLVASLIGQLMVREVGEENWSIGGYLKMRFRAPVRPGDTITASAIEEDGVYKVSCRNQNGVEVITGNAGIEVAQLR